MAKLLASTLPTSVTMSWVLSSQKTRNHCSAPLLTLTLYHCLALSCYSKYLDTGKTIISNINWEYQALLHYSSRDTVKASLNFSF